MSSKADVRIKAIIKQVSPLFENIEIDRKMLIDMNIRKLAFIQATLERLEDAVNDGEIIEDFAQGSQNFKRENSALKSYNSTIKSYNIVMKQLIDILPPCSKEKAGTQLMEFLQNKREIR